MMSSVPLLTAVVLGYDVMCLYDTGPMWLCISCINSSSTQTLKL